MDFAFEIVQVFAIVFWNFLLVFPQVLIQITPAVSILESPYKRLIPIALGVCVYTYPLLVFICKRFIKHIKET